ncbi:hypothetical protein HanRHA438_Chr01g0026211 [Helianthus annuus]|uniref:Uncharacterized protein n=1 Tax=Helianthus annuus TaxID=4232 RepID=A0A9K3JWN7_HELAN|nr:hypothetical protein HanXRQr2_Chr01g0025801 [Helianthus annuus]KAJ0948350.1 hypothetical protein HanRHA438_Chr01g0026211 [Helianthus annuus]KAJ0957239.1 hypothetical protein HanPSC8_Chr01g0024921 [Helianthus annuus]
MNMIVTHTRSTRTSAFAFSGGGGAPLRSTLTFAFTGGGGAPSRSTHTSIGNITLPM